MEAQKNDPAASAGDVRSRRRRHAKTEEIAQMEAQKEAHKISLVDARRQLQDIQ